MNFSSVTFAFARGDVFPDHVHCHVQCDIKLPDAKSRHPPGMTARTHGRSYRTSSVDTPTRFRTAHSQRDDIPRARARHTPRSRPRGASPHPSSAIIIIIVVVFVVVGPGSSSSLWGKSPTPPPPFPPPRRGLVVISAVAVGGGRDAVAGGRGRGHHRGVIVPPLFGRGGWGGRDSRRRGRRRGTRCSQCRDWPLRGRSRNSRRPRAGAA